MYMQSHNNIVQPPILFLGMKVAGMVIQNDGNKKLCSAVNEFLSLSLSFPSVDQKGCRDRDAELHSLYTKLYYRHFLFPSRLLIRHPSFREVIFIFVPLNY